jgi:hypothetical protein
LDSPDLQRWLTAELQTLNLGDKRLNSRCRLILHRLCRHPNYKFNSACDTDAECDGAYRFVHNSAVAEQAIFAPHFAATCDRIRQQPVALLVNDTTENDLTRPNERLPGAGPLNDSNRWGLFVHPLMAFTPDGIPLGLADVFLWARDPEAFAKPAAEKDAQRRKKTIEEKESIRWINSYAKTCAVAAACPDTQIVYLGDSEADIFELFYAARPEAGVKKADYIVRGAYDRALEPLTAGAPAPLGHLLAEVAATKVLATAVVDVSARPAPGGEERKRKQARQGRQATVSIRAKQVKLRVPANKPKSAGSAFNAMSDVTVNVVLVREESPPQGEEAIAWLLLTTLPIDTLTQVQTVIRSYCVRWQIEIYFRVLKSGCEVEKSQLETAQRYKNYLAPCMIVAWRVMYLMMLGRKCPEMPCAEVLEEDEWQVVYAVVTQRAVPEKAPTLGLMLLLIAALGGHMGRPSDGEPGPKATWRGMHRMADMVKGWRAAKATLATNPSGQAEASGVAEAASQQGADTATRPKAPRAPGCPPATALSPPPGPSALPTLYCTKF